MVIVLVVASVMTLTVALVVIVKAWCGKTIDDHPVCQRCQYDVYGITGPTCPECGADLTDPCAVRVGNRRRQPALLTAGLALAALSLGGLGLWAYEAATGFQL